MNVDLRVMAMKEYSVILKFPGLEPHQQMYHIEDILFFWVASNFFEGYTVNQFYALQTGRSMNPNPQTNKQANKKQQQQQKQTNTETYPNS